MFEELCLSITTLSVGKFVSVSVYLFLKKKKEQKRKGKKNLLLIIFRYVTILKSLQSSDNGSFTCFGEQKHFRIHGHIVYERSPTNYQTSSLCVHIFFLFLLLLVFLINYLLVTQIRILSINNSTKKLYRKFSVIFLYMWKKYTTDF